jgi:hypothetical protein
MVLNRRMGVPLIILISCLVLSNLTAVSSTIPPCGIRAVLVGILKRLSVTGFRHYTSASKPTSVRAVSFSEKMSLQPKGKDDERLGRSTKIVVGRVLVGDSEDSRTRYFE